MLEFKMLKLLKATVVTDQSSDSIISGEAQIEIVGVSYVLI